MGVLKTRLIFYFVILKGQVNKMDYRASIVVSCWLAIAVISSVYMFVFGPNIDVMFGVLLPIGFLVLIAVIVTFMVLSSSEKTHNN